MKKKLFFSTLMVIGFCTISLAQRGPHHGNRYHTSYSYNSDRGYYNAYGSYDLYASRMDRYDRKRLRKLVSKLRERERCAWEDGFVTRRERRRINEVRADIEYLIRPFRDTRRYRSYGYRSGCR